MKPSRTIAETIAMMEATARKLSTAGIESGIRAIGRSSDNALSMARAALFTVYEERVGEEACDKLLDEIGL